MTNFFAPADRADDWKQLLAKPYHWKTGRSAKSLAHSWTEAGGFPHDVSRTFNSSRSAELHGLEFLVGFPEYEVDLPGGKRPSQNDVFVLAMGSHGLVTIAVEGKVSEPFDRPVGERFADPTPGQEERLNYLLNLLGLERRAVDDIGYQLLHRSASAIIEARRFGATHAVMLVHSFSQKLEHFDDYSRFAALYGIEGRPNSVVPTGRLDDVNFSIGWVIGSAEYLSR